MWNPSPILFSILGVLLHLLEAMAMANINLSYIIYLNLNFLPHRKQRKCTCFNIQIWKHVSFHVFIVKFDLTVNLNWLTQRSIFALTDASILYLSIPLLQPVIICFILCMWFYVNCAILKWRSFRSIDRIYSHWSELSNYQSI